MLRTRVSGLFLEWRGERECGHGTARVTYAVGKFGNGVYEPSLIGGGGAHRLLAADLFRYETKAFRGRAGCERHDYGRLKIPRLARRRHDDA